VASGWKKAAERRISLRDNFVPCQWQACSSAIGSSVVSSLTSPINPQFPCAGRGFTSQGEQRARFFGRPSSFSTIAAAMLKISRAASFLTRTHVPRKKRMPKRTRLLVGEGEGEGEGQTRAGED